MAIDKSLKQHYEPKAGVKNFLGKQKMVKAPKYLLSKPGHVKAKLAYITDEEEQILIDKNLYGSLRGRPNKGPAGLPSLQGGDFGSGRSDSGSRNGGNGSHDRGGWQHHRAATQPRQTVTVTPKSEPKDKPTIDVGFQEALRKQYVEPVIVPKDEPKIDVGFQEALRKQKIEEDLKEKLDKDFLFEGTKAKAPTTLEPKIPKLIFSGHPHREGVLPYHYYQTQKHSPTYYQDRSRIDGKTYGERAEAAMPRSSGILGTLGKIALTGLTAGAGAGLFGKDIANIAKAAKWVGRGKDIKTALDTGKLNILGKEFDLPSNLRSSIDKAKAAKFRDERTTLGKEDIENWERKQDWSAVKPSKDGGDGEATIAKQVAGDENVIAKAINQYRGTEAEAQIANLVKTNLNQALQYYSMMTPKIEAGKANKQEMDAYELLGYYLNEAAPKQQNLAYGGRIDKPLMGRVRDI